MTMIKTQLQNHDEVRDVLRRVNKRFVLHGGEAVETYLVYLECKNGSCSHSRLMEILKDTILTNFVLNYTEIQKKLAIKEKKSKESLFKKAARKISKHTAKGELGELLLYALLDVYLRAPKILSKISLKTSRRMAVHGADAVHAQFVNGKIRVYLGESKLHESFSSAATSAVKSISDIYDKYEDEFDLIDSHIDFPGINDKQKQELLDLLDPFKETGSIMPENLHTPCFIGFVGQEIFSNHQETYLNNYIEVAKKYIGDFYAKARNKNIETQRTALLMLPFSSLDILVDEFILHMGIKE